MRIAIAAEGTRGDIHPMLALAEHLIGAGHFVRFCAPPDFGDVVTLSGAEFVAVGANARGFMSENAAALHAGGIPLVRAIRAWEEQSLASQFRALPEAFAGMDRVLAAGTILGGASAAELHGIPFRFVAYTPALLPSPDHSPAFFPLQTRSRLANRALWWSARALFAVTVRRDLSRARRALGLPPVSDLIRHVFSPRPVLAVDRPLASLPADCPIPAAQIPCLHPRNGEPLPEKLERFLAAGPAPVFLGFGSMPDPDPAATTERLLRAIDTLGCRALISRGWAGLGEVALPETVMAIGAVSHAQLFPRMAAVVHHGGAGTTHTAARAGVPQIAIPHVLDQFYFARRVHELGVGAPGRGAARDARQRAPRRPRVRARPPARGRRAGGDAPRITARRQSGLGSPARAAESPRLRARPRPTAPAAPPRGWPPSRCRRRRRRARAASACPRRARRP
jgi:vancomycin aglycone glucosyltransferase